jgi:hypothetical protein
MVQQQKGNPACCRAKDSENKPLKGDSDHGKKHLEMRELWLHR